MLDRSRPPRKDSLRNCANCRWPSGLLSEPLQLGLGRSFQESLGGGGWKDRVPQQGVPDVPSKAPAGVLRDDDQGLGAGPRLDGRLDDVRFGREAIVQERGDDAGVGVLAERE